MKQFVVRLCVLAVLACLGSAADMARAAEAPRSLPFNRQNVYSYFKQVEEGRRALPENLPPKEFQARVCALYATVLKRSGYDFEATVKNAVQNGIKGSDKLNDPRFLFLAGVFQVHPDVFLRLKLISKPTRDAVMAYFH